MNTFIMVNIAPYVRDNLEDKSMFFTNFNFMQEKK